jgi:hypothetical protein
MDRRQLLAGLAASAAFAGAQSKSPSVPNTFLELKTWQLHNSAEEQGPRVAEYLESGLAPALDRAGAKLAGAFSNLIAGGGPFYVTLAQYSSLAAMQDALTKIAADSAHQTALQKLSAGPGLPFVRVDSSLLRSFDNFPEVAILDPAQKRPPRVFELRTYESQSFFTLARKVKMFNQGEMQIFERLQMRPVFFGETIVGPRQPNLTYMLSYDDLAKRDELWHAFGTDPEWKKLSGQPQLKDSEIVANISNVILRPLAFSQVR